MRRQRKKPEYRYESGAYSTAPRVKKIGAGYSAEGNIQCWRGSVEDLSRAGNAGIAALGEENAEPITVSVSCTDSAGQHLQFESLDAFVESESEDPEDSLNTVRIEIRQEAAEFTAAIVVRRTMPGLAVSVTGRSRIEVDGLARLLFREVMAGYIDRYAGVWRWLAAVSITLVPGVLTYAIAADRWDHWPNLLLVCFAIGGTLVTIWTLGQSWQWTLYRTPTEFVPDKTPPGPDRRSQVEQFVRRPRVVKTIALIGVLVVGIVTNKLSDLIPWP